MTDNDSASSSPLSSPCDPLNDPSSGNSDVELDNLELGPAGNDENVSSDDARLDRDAGENGAEEATIASRPNTPNADYDDGDDRRDWDDDRRGKRKRLEATPPPLGRSKKKQVISPPWKKIEADGPSTITENGRRKSGRINTLLQDLQSPAAKGPPGHAIFGPPLSPAKNKPATATALSATPTNTTTRNTAPRARPSKSIPKSAPRPSTARTPSRPTAHDAPRPRPRRAASPPRQPARQPTRSSQRLTRHSRDAELGDDDARTPGRGPSSTRIRLRVPIQLSHPCQVRLPKIATSFEEWWAKAFEIPVAEGGLLLEDEPIYTADTALRDAETMRRIEAELQPGGMLSEGRCSALAPEPQPTPAKQYGHLDHLAKAAANLRRLMLAEKQRHCALAKKLAEACRDRWLERQPKTAEQLEMETRELCLGRYKAVLKTLSGTWANVREEVNRRRYEEFEAEEQRRVKAALNQAVNLSELKLAQRAGHALSGEEDEGDINYEDLGSEFGWSLSGDDGDDGDDDASARETDDDSGGGGDVDADGDEDDDNMSSSSGDEDEDDAGGDANLTPEQLRAKYANLPGLDSETALANDHNSDDDTSDESVDMDDDLGSSDGADYSDSDESGSGDEDDEDEDEEGEVDGQSGLLGLLFGKAELQKIHQEAAAEDGDQEGRQGCQQEGQQEEDENVDMAEATPGADSDSFVADEEDDEVCLIPVGGSATGKSTPQCSALPSAMPSAAASPSVKPTELPGLNRRHQEVATSPPQGGDGASDKAGDACQRTDASSKPTVLKKSHDESENPDDGSSEPMALDIAPAAAATEPYTPEPTPMDLGDRHSHSPTAPGPPTEPSHGDESIVAAPQQPQQPLTNGHTDSVDAPNHADSSTTAIDTPADHPTAAATSSERESAPSTNTTISATAPPTKSESPSPATGPKTPIPFLLRGTLREYQHYGLDWLAGLYANRTNGILADEMGLGKTIQTIALLAHLACQHEVWGPHLVIVPTSVMLNWEMEFKKWCPGFKILAYYGSQEERKRKRQGWTNDDVWNVCVTSYQLVLQDHQVFRRRRWHYMILDEAHNIKNFKSQRWQTLLGFNTRSRLLLTGTPLQNNLTELWSLLFFLMPGEQNQAEGFADLDEFRQWFARPETQILESGREKMDDEARAIISKLHQVLRPYLLRRLKADVERQMPAKYEHVEMCRLSKRQRELYDGFLSRTDTRETLASGNYLSIINCLMQLRKVCNHPDLFVDRPIMTSFKMRRSVPGHYVATEQLVKDRLLAAKPMTVVDLGFLNLVPARHEGLATTTAERIQSLTAQRALNHHRDLQRARVGNVRPVPDGSTVHSVLAHFEWRARASRRHELQHSVYVSALRKQQMPVYGKNLIKLLTIGADARLRRPRPNVPQKVIDWFTDRTDALDGMVLTVDRRALSCEGIISKFACVTPAVVTGDMAQLVLGAKGAQAFRDEDLRLSEPVRWAPFIPKERPADPWHEARMRLSIQFPDKRLLQYDCGKLQALDQLLRGLQAGGHRALIFTQMTKVLDILEQFLNMHGHKYLRLDGATKVEQRQILTDRFNNDTRILCFILSTRSGGLGINLTGADTVIFYDQDWNPAMDKQCQDRCHRIGQTRDVHIYRLISEHTIEANILRKATQKQMLDDVVIQEGEFTTDYLNRLSVHDVIGHQADNDDDALGGSGAAANAAMDRLLGGADGSSDNRSVGRVLEQAEDREDVAAAKAAEKETQADEADFDEDRPGRRDKEGTAGADEGIATPAATHDNENAGQQDAGPVEYNADGDRMGTIDDHMLRVMRLMVEGTMLELPRDKKKIRKRRRDTRKR